MRGHARSRLSPHGYDDDDRPKGTDWAARLRTPRTARQVEVGSVAVKTAEAEDGRGAGEDDYRRSHLGRGADYDAAIASAAFDAYMARVERDLLLEIVPGLFPAGISRYLDFACGTGRVTQVVGALASHSVGVDVSPSMVEQAKEKCPQTQFVLQDLTLEPLAVAPFDLVTTFRFLGNAQPDLRSAALRALHDLVAPRGRLIVNNHRNPVSFHSLLRRLRGKANEPGLTFWRLRHLLEENGFEVERAYAVGAWVVRYAWRTSGVLDSERARRLDRMFQSGYVARFAPDMVVVARRR